MPELPEVETIIRILKRLVVDKTIDNVEIMYDKTIENELAFFKSALMGTTILDITRTGKYLVFHLNNDYVLVSHLRMEGKYFLRNKNEPFQKHDLVVFMFSDNSYLSYNDTRRFGRMKILKKSDYLNVAPLSNVGPDPFMISDIKILKKAYANKNIAIKTALLSQNVMSGLGNIYVDEVLFKVGIHPLRKASSLSDNELNNILIAAKSVLQKAIDMGGSTIKSYHPSVGVSGNFQVELEAYGRNNKNCLKCGSKMKRIIVNGRGTTICPLCQRKSGVFVVGLTGPIGVGKSTATKIFKELGYKTYSSDAIVHKLYKTKKIQKRIKAFIPTLKIVDNEIDREYLKDYLLNNKETKTKLETLIHEEVLKELLAIKNKAKDGEVLIYEIPLLFESHAENMCDLIIYVDASINNRLVNLKSRNENTEKAIKLNSNFNEEINKKKSDIILDNNGTIADLKKQIEALKI